MSDPMEAKISSPAKARKHLIDNLQKALMLELSTIPAYATACYSIQEQGQYNRSSPEIINAEPIETIRQVMVEEMLHMVLAANLINALGGEPTLIDPKQVPKYPYKLFKHSDLTIHLRRFIPDQVKVFREIETAPKPENLERAAQGNYRTIGGFYYYISNLLNKAHRKFGKNEIFVGDISRQITNRDYYGGGGEVIVVDSLKSAQRAISEIVDEGEGAQLGEQANDGDRIPSSEDIERWDVAHYFKFDGILRSRYYEPTDILGGPPTGKDLVVDWKAVWPMRDNPGETDYSRMPDIQALSDKFNHTYSELLHCLNHVFNGEKEMLAGMVPIMYRLKYDAQQLMSVPLTDSDNGETAGPAWQFIADI